MENILLTRTLRLPITFHSGSLEAGKTILVNQVRKNREGGRFAFIVYEIVQGKF